MGSEIENNEPYFTDGYFYDVIGNRVLEKDLNQPFKIADISAQKLGATSREREKGLCLYPGPQLKNVSKWYTGNFKMWHVEFPAAPDIERGNAYIDLPILDIRNKTDEAVKDYNNKMQVAWTHAPWHQSHVPQTYKLTELAQEIARTLDQWKNQAKKSFSLSELPKRVCRAIEKIEIFFTTSNRAGIQKELELLKQDAMNATATEEC